MHVKCLLLCLATTWSVICGAMLAGPPVIEGYSNYETMTAKLRELAEHDAAALRSLATTDAGREVWLMTIGEGDDEARAARSGIFIAGSVHAPHLLGSELAVRIAQKLLADDPGAQQLRRQYTFHILPRPNPDASEAFFTPPYEARTLNTRPVDEDNDGRIDEDGPDDLNGDGFITMMRTADAAGTLIPHPEEPRVLVEADPQQDEQPIYRLMIEGRDNDGDGKLNEDAAGGVDFNRNFAFNYPFFELGAGPHQLSEPETRGVADFIMSQPNLALALTFDPADNLMKLWPSEASDKQGRIKTRLLTEDVSSYKRLAEIYKKHQPLKSPPAAERSEGSIAQWLYFHFGRWSLSARGWWVPQVKVDGAKGDEQNPQDADDADENQEKEEQEKEGKGAKKDERKPDTRGSDERNVLRWFDQQNIDGFVDWRPIDHPDFPGQQVEVGGIKPFLTLNPPAEQFADLAELHYAFLREVLPLLPEIAVERVKVEPLGENVYRVTAMIINRGKLPTMPQMGDVNGLPLHLQIRLELPDGARFIRSFPRQRVEVLSGVGGTAEQEWLVRTTSEQAIITVYSPSVGAARHEVKLR